MKWLKHLIFATLAASSVSSAAHTAQFAVPSAAAPNATALVNLGERYENGESIRRDYDAALTLYCRAAARGDAQAFYNLGWMYLNGRGVARNDATAAMWLRKAAAHGVPQAANLLGLLPAVARSAPQPCLPRHVLGGTTNVAARPGVMSTPPPAIRAMVDETAQHIGINPRLLLSVISVESGFNPMAVSPKSAAGLMQLMPGTAVRFSVRDRFDPRENIRGGATYLHSLLRMFDGNLTLALAAYNAGEQTVLSRGGVPPFPETLNYIAMVKGLCACDGLIGGRPVTASR